MAANDLALQLDALPVNATTFFIVSRMQGFVANPNGSVGNTCLVGSLGRYVGPGQIQNSGAGGTASLALDLMQLPTPTGFFPAMARDKWNFKAWHRDTSAAGIVVANVSNGLEVRVL